MKKYFILLLLIIPLLIQAQSFDSGIRDQTDQVEIINDSPETNVEVMSTSPRELLEDGAVKLLAALLLGLIGWGCQLVNKYLNIKIMTSQVTGVIVRQAEQLEKVNMSNDEKRALVVEHITKNKKKKLSKWADILYGGLEEAVSTVYKTVVKKALKV
jgi:hypothetical protein